MSEPKRQSKKIQIILPSGKKGGLLTVGSIIKLKGENFCRRVNSDGTLTKIHDGKNGTISYNRFPLEVKNKILVRTNAARKQAGLLEIDYNGHLRTTHYPTANNKFWYSMLSRTEGSNSFLSSAGSIAANLVFLNRNYYDGKVHPARSVNKVGGRNSGNSYTNWKKDDNRNYIRAFTLKDYTGFKPSDEIGRGRYESNPKYKDLPYLLGNFYGDTIYAPTKAAKIFDLNLNKQYKMSKDSVIDNGVNWKYANDTYDARHHSITFKKNKGLSSVLLEDVFDTNNSLVDYFNNPFIVNLMVPVVFTDDEEKLNRFPWLSNWFTNPRNIVGKTKD